MSITLTTPRRRADLRGPAEGSAQRRQPVDGHGVDHDHRLRREGLRGGARRPAPGPAASIRPASCWSSPPVVGSPSLDAEVRIGEGTPGEVVVIRMRGPVGAHPASVIRPLLLPDSPVVIWWPGRLPGQPGQRRAGPAGGPPAHRRRRRRAAAGGAAGPGQDLPARRHRPGLDPADPVAGTAGRGLGPVPGPDQGGHGRGGARQPVGRPAGGVAADAAQGAGASRRSATVPGITAVRMTTAAGDIAITRPDGLLASYAVPGQPERLVALKRREITDLISEELRRLDDDPVYESAVKALLTVGSHGEEDAGPAKKAADPAEGELTVPGGPEVLVHGGADDVAEALTARLLARITELQRDFQVPQIALTGGRIATQAYGRLAGRGPQLGGRLESGRALVGRRALRRRPTTTTATPKQALDLLTPALPLDGQPHPPDAGQRRRPRSGRGRRGVRRRAGRDHLRHLPARHGTRRPRRVDLPRAPVVVRAGPGDRRTVLAQAAAGADQPHPAR